MTDLKRENHKQRAGEMNSVNVAEVLREKFSRARRAYELVQKFSSCN